MARSSMGRCWALNTNNIMRRGSRVKPGMTRAVCHPGLDPGSPLQRSNLMKKLLIPIFAIALAILMPAALHADEINVTIDSVTVDFEGQPPIIIDGRTLVPVRGVFEALGFATGWNPDFRSVTLIRDDHSIQIIIGHSQFYTSNGDFELDVPAQIIDGRTLVPIRALVEAVGYHVEWDADTNTVVISSTPIKGGNAFIPMISSDDGRAMAILPDGSLWGWGANRYGQVGDGTTQDRYSPVHIMDDVIYVSVSRNHTMAITSDGRLWGWGGNFDGQLGDGTTQDRHSPIHIMDDVISVAAGNSFTMAVTSDGNLWSWGSNWNNLVATHENIDIHTPVKLMDDVVYVSSADNMTMVIGRDHSLWSWEFNTFDLSSILDVEPIQIMEDVKAVSATYWATSVIQNNGSFWYGWAIDMAGMFEIGVFQRTGFTHWYWIEGPVAAVSTGNWHTMVLMEDSSLWGGGDNYWGQLGDGTRENQYGLIRLMDGVVAVDAGPHHTLAILSDGSIWGWGASNRILGDEERRSDHLVPVLIMESTTPSIATYQPAEAHEAENNENIYIVQVNDTLWSIAVQFFGDGRYYADILAANNMTEAQWVNIAPGTEIIIPDGVAGRPRTLVHFSQMDPRWANVMFGGFTVAEGGCGPASIAMVASTLHEREVLPCYVATWGRRFYVQGVGAAHTLFTGEATQNHFGLDYRAINIHGDDAVLEALRNGAMIITSVQSSRSPNARPGNQGIFNPIGLGGHIAVIYGVTADGNVLIASPRVELDNEEGWPLDVVRRELHSGINIFWTYTAREGHTGSFGRCHTP